MWACACTFLRRWGRAANWACPAMPLLRRTGHRRAPRPSVQPRSTPSTPPFPRIHNPAAARRVQAERQAPGQLLHDRPHAHPELRRRRGRPLLLQPQGQPVGLWWVPATACWPTRAPLRTGPLNRQPACDHGNARARARPGTRPRPRAMPASRAQATPCGGTTASPTRPAPRSETVSGRLPPHGAASPCTARRIEPHPLPGASWPAPQAVQRAAPLRPVPASRFPHLNVPPGRARPDPAPPLRPAARPQAPTTGTSPWPAPTRRAAW